MNMPRVLVIEDDPDQSDFLRDCLEGEGYSVETAFSGDVGLRRLEERTYNAAIMDVRMPGLSGGTVLKVCHHKVPPCTTPIVIVSAYATEKEQKQFAHDGAAAFFAKPYEIVEVLAKIRELVQNGRPH